MKLVSLERWFNARGYINVIGFVSNYFRRVLFNNDRQKKNGREISFGEVFILVFNVDELKVNVVDCFDRLRISFFFANWFESNYFGALEILELFFSLIFALTIDFRSWRTSDDIDVKVEHLLENEINKSKKNEKIFSLFFLR